nr:hypothetical protein [Tanacetum cinerariifolium]
MAGYSQKWHNGTSRTKGIETSDGLATIQAQLNNLGRDIMKVNEKCGLQRLDVYSNRTTLLDDSLPKKEKDPGSFTLPCNINNVCFEKALADLGASVNFMPLSTYLNLGLGKLAHTKLTVELADRTVKYPKGIAKNVLVGIGKFIFPVDFIILDMPEDVNVPLILERPFLSTAQAKVDAFIRKITLRVGDEKIIFKSVKHAISLINKIIRPLYEDYIKLNDLNEPLELRRNRVDDLEPTIKEDMGPYLDEGMEDVIVGEPFWKASYVEAKRFYRIITIRDRDDNVTYQLVLSNLWFKYLTNEKCNKISLLLKVSEQDKMNGISHSYQKLKGFYKEVLNLGPECIRDAKVEEWLTRGHIRVHEMEFRIRCIHAHDTAYLENLTRIDTFIGPRWKEIDKVGEVSIIWNPMCVVVMLEFRRIYNTHSCSYTQLGESY